MLHTTFNLAHKARACKEYYVKFAESVGGINKYGKDTPIPLTQVLDVCGLDDALWCLFCVLPEEEKERDKLARLFACDCAEHVIGIFEKHYPDDKRPRQAIDIARRFAQGEASLNELAAARAAAWDAERKWQEAKFREYMDSSTKIGGDPQ